MVPGYAQTFPPLGDDATTSLGSFRLQISNTFAGMFNGCPGYNATTHVLQSPTLFDPATIIGRSNPGPDDGDRPAARSDILIRGRLLQRFGSAARPSAGNCRHLGCSSI
jgi:hypothetical protein